MFSNVRALLDLSRDVGRAYVRTWVFAILGLIALSAFSGWGAQRAAPRVEEDVRGRVERVLMAEGLGFADATVSGRDVYLRGALANDTHYRAAVNAVSAVPGVRRVMRTESPGVPSLVRVTVSTRELILRGEVSQPDVRAAVVVAAGEALRRRILIDSLKVNLGRADPVWMDEFGTVLTLIREEIGGFDLYFAGNSLYVEGRASDELQRAELGERLGELLPGFVIHNAIRIPVLRDEVEDSLRSFLSTRPIEFPTESEELTEELAQTLDRLIPILMRFPDVRFRIESHVGASAETSWDDILTNNRANAVREYLVERGVLPTRLEAVGMGGRQPIADNSTPGGRTLNDRVEIHVIEES